MAEEIALLFAAIVILATEGAALVGGQGRLADVPFRKRVVMAAENCLQVVLFEPRQELFGVLRSRDHMRTEREVREDNQRPLSVKLGKCLVEPAQGVRLH